MNRVLIFTLIFFLIGTLFLGNFQLVEAKKSEGTPIHEIMSDKVCGDKLCEKPMTVKEKIHQYLLELYLRGDLTSVFQQSKFAIGGAVMIGGRPLN